MKKNIEPALKFENFLHGNKINVPKNAKLIKLFEAQEVDDIGEGDENGDDFPEESQQQNVQPKDAQTQKQPISDDGAYNDESLLDDDNNNNGISTGQNNKGANVGGGIMPICTTTGNILLGRRSDRVSESGTWSIWGGRLDIPTANEINPINIKNKVIEVFEDMTKYNKFEDIIPSYVYETKENNFKWFNFLGLVDEEFEPMNDWRVIEYKWMTMDEIRSLGRDALHFGLQLLFDNDSDTIRPLLIPKPKEESDDVENNIQEQPDIENNETPETQDEFGEPDTQENNENQEGI